MYNNDNILLEQLSYNLVLQTEPLSPDDGFYAKPTTTTFVFWFHDREEPKIQHVFRSDKFHVTTKNIPHLIFVRFIHPFSMKRYSSFITNNSTLLLIFLRTKQCSFPSSCAALFVAPATTTATTL